METAFLDWRQQSNGQRKKIRDLESQIDLLQARPTVAAIPDDYEADRLTEARASQQGQARSTTHHG